MTYYLHKDRVPKIKLNLFNLKLDCMEVKGQTKGSRKLGERQTEWERQTRKSQNAHIHTFHPENWEQECGVYVEVEESGWCVLPLHALGKHLQGKQKARVWPESKGGEEHTGLQDPTTFPLLKHDSTLGFLLALFHSSTANSHTPVGLQRTGSQTAAAHTVVPIRGKCLDYRRFTS